MMHGIDKSIDRSPPGRTNLPTAVRASHLSHPVFVLPPHSSLFSVWVDQRNEIQTEAEVRQGQPGEDGHLARTRRPHQPDHHLRQSRGSLGRSHGDSFRQSTLVGQALHLCSLFSFLGGRSTTQNNRKSFEVQRCSPWCVM